MQSYTITFGIGLGEDRHGKPIDPFQVDAIVALAEAAVTEQYGGCFITFGRGPWRNDKGDIVREHGCRIVATLIGSDYDRARVERDAWRAAEQLAKVANQEAAYVDVVECAASLRYPAY